ncbi:uncharacterized protein LOC123379195 isoform X7 [Felis catus]|uniref:uncharacterized protein LOC123379195 isoform X7 n=1 Tax=Felis catus TaxID=9685 RepID=UPI001D199992|nr:uncharacterized protein LOC123379195 isoform X7 [Felis catus]
MKMKEKSLLIVHTRERSRCLYHWNFALQIIYKILFLHAHLRTNTICIQNRTVYKFNGVILDMTHCSWCNPQGPEKLYFKPYLKKRIFMEGEKEAAFSPQGRLYRCCHIPPRCLLESKATSIPLEILLALPSKYIQNLGSSSGKRNIRPTIKLGSTSRNEEHWKWNQASIVHFHLSDCENQTQNHFTGSGPWLLISTLEPRTKWEENDSEFLGAIPSHLCKSQSLRHSPSGVSRTIFHQDFPTQAVPRLGNYQEVTRTSASRGITPDSAPSLSSEPSAL